MLGWCARGQERDELKEDQLWLVVVSRLSFGASATSCQDKQVPSVTHTHTHEWGVSQRHCHDRNVSCSSGSNLRITHLVTGAILNTIPVG